MVAGAFFGTVVVIGGCGRHRVVEPSVDGLPEEWQLQAEAGVPLADWFAAWQVPELSALLRRLDDNLRLRAAQARLLAARAEARVADGGRWPRLEAGLQASRGRRDAGRFDDLPAGLAPEPQAETRWQASLSARYELDLWGRLLAEAEAGALQANAVGADARALRIGLAATVAEQWLAIVAGRRLLQLAEKQLALGAERVRLLERRYRQGTGDRQRLLQARSRQVEERRRLAELPQVLAQARHRLAVLLGVVPAALVVERRQLPRPPPLPDAGLPADLLLRRPDLRAAAWRAAAADWRARARAADRLPRLQLGASLSDTAAHPAGLLDRLAWQLVAAISETFFDGGRRRALEAAARAQSSAALDDFGQRLLQAVREVVDALAAERVVRQQLRETQRALRLSREQVVLAQRRYRLGQAAALALLDRRLAEHRRQASLLRARQRLAVARIGLYRSLGGGWNDSAEEARESSRKETPEDSRIAQPVAEVTR